MYQVPKNHELNKIKIKYQEEEEKKWEEMGKNGKK